MANDRKLVRLKNLHQERGNYITANAAFLCRINAAFHSGGFGTPRLRGGPESEERNAKGKRRKGARKRVLSFGFALPWQQSSNFVKIFLFGHGARVSSRSNVRRARALKNVEHAS